MTNTIEVTMEHIPFFNEDAGEWQVARDGASGIYSVTKDDRGTIYWVNGKWSVDENDKMVATPEHRAINAALNNWTNSQNAGKYQKKFSETVEVEI